MTKVIKITTEQYNRYIFEGIDYKKQGTQYDAVPIAAEYCAKFFSK